MVTYVHDKLYEFRRPRNECLNRIVCYTSELLIANNKIVLVNKLCHYFALQNESEIIPFPNGQHEFSLPEADFKEPKERPFPRVMTSSGDADDTAKDHHGKDSTKDHVKDGLYPEISVPIQDRFISSSRNV